MDQQSLKVRPSDVAVLNASGKAVLPTQQNCLSQLSHVHRLRDSELNYRNHMYNIDMQMLRNREGLSAPLKFGMDRYAAQQIGRLPFLQSSNMMDDVLTGRCDEIAFEDFLNPPEFCEHMRQPHAVVEKSMGFQL